MVGGNITPLAEGAKLEISARLRIRNPEILMARVTTQPIHSPGEIGESHSRTDCRRDPPVSPLARKSRRAGEEQPRRIVTAEQSNTPWQQIWKRGAVTIAKQADPSVSAVSTYMNRDEYLEARMAEWTGREEY
ncbi:unnamed protein product [Diplocarpon coronariae]|uniref:Uncharacterized protein n=1 Tax=Diplocarpon coronariae TaxID=2795749 RepID=A0A218Z4D2_9HELO|nr:hypothetical protein B2J93_1302 [Marssonina coronariae]